ncbi:hypothetical protein LAUMK35_03669 [Mycobacterium pseudokansasii]|uniref:Uncharacterized protein n=1 Tax=Mycobacterium pseudokansasii TaxID=2341080 RepID=A0A498QTD1_9MYCO|nr:hypothetical protein LAUMK35_03669 [Mycobacterium pseudokansasii]VAZ98869.1 hypothetical protein LAUMK21_03666 [Mycobacterium pseudokansasii]VBA52438.1 hypothetical protein LAUMK142_03559 [Mycobacterium pseudokansasii]
MQVPPDYLRIGSRLGVAVGNFGINTCFFKKAGRSPYAQVNAA